MKTKKLMSIEKYMNKVKFQIFYSITRGCLLLNLKRYILLKSGCTRTDCRTCWIILRMRQKGKAKIAHQDIRASNRRVVQEMAREEEARKTMGIVEQLQS